MKQRFTQYSGLFWVAAVGILVGTPVFAADLDSVDDQARRQELSTKLVEEALRREVNGQAKARDEILKQALDRDSSNATARWQSGFVWDGTEWVRVNEISQSETLQARIRQYEEMRAQCADTAVAQWQLANWCALSGLKLQERAHLYRVVQLLPDHQGARQRLGFRRINGRWQRLESIWQGLKDAQSAAQSLRTWGPRLVEVRKLLLQKNRVKRDDALSQLRALSDVRAIPAVETVLTGHNPVLSQIAVDWFAARPHHQASMALVRQALFSPWTPIRVAAVSHLAQRPRDHYIPPLLTELSAPIESRMQRAVVNGQLVYRHIFVREGQSENDVVVRDRTFVPRDARRGLLPVVNSPFNLPFGGTRAGTRGRETRPRNLTLAQATEALLERADARRRADAQMRVVKAVRERRQRQQNEQINQQNQQIFAVLRGTTGQALRQPQQWWDWWDRQNEVNFTGEKPNNVDYGRREVSVALVNGVGSTRRRGECFVAGTPVWTINGPMAIDQVQAGDLVLSQHPETGELTYQPVLQRTMRPIEPLVRIHLAEESLVASGGHPFWVLGKGWVLLRKLRVSQQLHGLDGAVPVAEIEPAPAAVTYNLVVDRFQTYFVGQDRLLCHDNSERRPTNALVPGLLKE
ncbi:MAG: polymorphic toxin-type HINT domain-containing protein [Planctomycetota bacterium]|nr:polymorphic toxin-type HINT domain-containing protein [Planctomycetota bacterium]